MSKEPSRFRLALPEEDICFIHFVYLDLVFLEKQAVLHDVDRDTLVSEASTLNGQSTPMAWDAFMQMWVIPLLGYLEELHADEGSHLR